MPTRRVGRRSRAAPQDGALDRTRICSKLTAMLRVLLVLLIAASPALAEVAVLQDSRSSMALSVPDDWARATPALPDTVLEATVPAAAARLTVRRAPDARFTVYPPRYDGQIQRIAVGPEFWNAYWAAHTSAHTVHQAQNGAGLGRAYAGLAEARFVPLSGPTKDQERRGFVAAGLYRGERVTATCDAPQAAWARWRDTCARILGTVQERQTDAPFTHGHYRDFTADSDLTITGPRPPDARTY